MGKLYEGGKFVQRTRTPEQQQRYDEYFGEVDNPKSVVAGHFIGCPIWWLLRVLAVVKSGQQLVVGIYLWRRRIQKGNRETFEVPNSELKSWGISRKVKYQALDWLAEAGLIKINRRGRAAVTVTILAKPPSTARRTKSTSD
jgi:hypothetical protein